ncbi:tryptophan 7-halogenase [Sphingomonas rhizophila]|uniref:Tryptophan 7-halogenase n=2 Tax=Sphingomonas rhizophila TaxID=2071607 RepID=A0A7G9SE34_9SPHN|nr:tryptophan 7-halogenase [Sphingomonas rhizophila]
MAATGLVSLLPPARCRVHLIESDEIGIVGVGEATLPQMKSFNDLCGIDEAEMMRATNATFKLGIQFVDWGSLGSSYIHPFGIHGPPGTEHIFHHKWLRASREGLPGQIDDFSFACRAGVANRFDFPPKSSQSIGSSYSYAYHFDASLYGRYLRTIAERRGVRRTEGKVANVETDAESGNIVALRLENGEEIRGDFFIDCSGFRSLLLGQTLDSPWEDWTKWLPCDRALAVPTERAGELTPYTRSTAMEAGWRWRIPLQHRTGNGYVFSSRFIDEDRAAEQLLSALDEPTLAEPRLLKFGAGRRTESWRKNCVALGLSSGFLEPLESTSIYLAQIAIMHFVPLFPERRADPSLAAEFNRRVDLEYDRIRDFLILHYHLNQRDDSELWRYCRSMSVPDSLTEKMELFRHSGFVEKYRDGLFTPPSWLAVYFGQGLRPEHYHPLADAIPAAALMDEMDDLRADIDDRVDAMLKHSTVVERYAGING